MTVERKFKTGEVVLAVLVFLMGLLPLVAPLPMPTGPVLTVLTALWAAALVPLARRKPHHAMLGTALLYASTNFWAVTTTTIAVFIAAKRITPKRRLWLVVLATAGAQLLGSLVNYLFVMPTSTAEIIGGNVFGFVFLLLLPALAGMLLGQRKPLIRLLRERNEYLERAQALTASKARTEERSHIAGEMHDMLGHRLSLISIHAGALELSTAKKSPELHEQAELVRTTAAIAMAELREILGVLRTNAEQETLDENAGTREDVTKLVDESCAAGLSVRLEWHGDDLTDADPRSRRAIHRVVREGLTNVHKHATNARTRVTVTVADGRAQVLVVNGTTLSKPGKGTRRGLIGLEERVGLLGGGFVAGPAPEGGFRVVADVPLHPAALADTPVEQIDEAPVPVAEEALTVPRLMASGCLGALVAVPVLSIVVGVLAFVAFGGGQIPSKDFDELQIGTDQAVITEKHGFGTADDEDCQRYMTFDRPEVDAFQLCFRDGKLASKKAIPFTP